MKTTCLASACLAVSLFLLPGCYESLTNIATADKAVYYEELVGNYKGVEPGTGRLTLARGKDKAYAYEQFDDKDALVNKGSLWLIKIGDELFYQISVDSFSTTDGRPMYAIGRLRIEGSPGAKTLTGYAFRSAETLFGDALVTTEEYEYTQGGERKKSRGLSMPPEKLQSYLSIRAAEMTEPTLKFQQTGPGR